VRRIVAWGMNGDLPQRFRRRGLRSHASYERFASFSRTRSCARNLANPLRLVMKAA
jgi:hypothetical protein